MSGEVEVKSIDPGHFLFAGRKVTFFLNGFECYIKRAGTKGAYEALARNLKTGVGFQTVRVFGEGAKVKVTEAIRQAVSAQ